MLNRELIKYKVHHLFFWMLIFGVWFFLRFEDYRLPGTALKVTFIKVVDLAVMVYITNYILLPRLFYRKKYVLFVAAFLALIIVSSLLKMNILGRVMNSPAYFSFSGNWKARIYDNVIPHFFLVVAGAAIKLMFDYSKLQQRMAETAKERAEAELNFLKSQINPHFLFNSLNSVYFLIDKQNAEARNSLHKFSDMLRYQLYEVNGQQIPIEREISYLQDYVDLQRLRKDDQYTVTFSHDPGLQHRTIEPLLLIPFVENAFKHISHHSNKPNYVKLDMMLENGKLRFSVENSKEQGVNARVHGGIGLVNVRRRLELIYPDTHQLTVTDGDEFFRITLVLQLNSKQPS